MTDYTDLIARLRGATVNTTSGVWQFVTGSHTAHCCFSASVVAYNAGQEDSVLEGFEDADVRFAVAAHQLVPEAAAAIDDLEAERDALRDALGKAANRLDWAAGIIALDAGRDQVSAWADEARAAITSPTTGG